MSICICIYIRTAGGCAARERETATDYTTLQHTLYIQPVDVL